MTAREARNILNRKNETIPLSISTVEGLIKANSENGYNTICLAGESVSQSVRNELKVNGFSLQEDEAGVCISW